MKSVAVIVAHPDDETLWAGGAILSNPFWRCHVVTLCRGSDLDRAPRFARALHALGAKGNMADLDDGPDQAPPDEGLVQQAILDALPARDFDLILTHNPTGEYSRHLRHEEISSAAISLWSSRELVSSELWTFAYEDRGQTLSAACYPGGSSLFRSAPACLRGEISHRRRDLRLSA